MREIKFRAWLKDSETKKPYALYFDLESISQGSIMARDGEWHYLVNLKDTTEQFTGLCDKNGKEIYEGDIVRAIDSNTHEYDDEIDDVVSFIGSCFSLSESWETLDYFGSNNLEIIGNIHENKELLK